LIYFVNNVVVVGCLTSCIFMRDRRRRDRMVVGFTTIYAISVYHL